MRDRWQGLGAQMPSPAWNALLAEGASTVHDVGAVLLRQGDPSGHVLLLTSGHVKITRVEPDGAELLLAVRGRGEVLGEFGVLDSAPRSATVTAVTRCLAYVLPGTRFVRLVDELGLRQVVLRHLLSRFREGEEIRAELAELPAVQRIARTLLRLASPSGGLVVPLTQDELARSAGLSRSAAAAEIAVLRQREMVTTARRRIVVTDPAGLREIAGL